MIIAPPRSRLDVLLKVLREEDIQPISSVDLGGGALLASALLDDITFAVLVLAKLSDSDVSFSALLVEAGVVLGRKIPLLVITDPSDQPPAALTSVSSAAIKADDEDALRLHLRIFARTAQLMPAASVLSRDAPIPDLSSERQELGGPRPLDGLQFERLALEVLRKSGAQVEVRDDGKGVDAVIGVRGFGGTSMVVVAEVKHRLSSRADLEGASLQLLQNMARLRADFGLIVTSEPVTTKSSINFAPMILVISIDELMDQLATQPLNKILWNARSRAVHGV